MCSERDGLIGTVVALHSTTRSCAEMKWKRRGSLVHCPLRCFAQTSHCINEIHPPFPYCGEAQGTLAPLRQDLIVGVSYAN